MIAPHPLRDSSLFGGLSSEQCGPFLPLARELRVGRGDYLFRLGEPAEALFVIRSGTVHLTMPLAVNGTEREVVVQEAGAGETIAWSALIEPYRFTMSAMAATEVDLLAFATRIFQPALHANPEAGVRIVTNLATVIAQRLQVMHAMWARDLQRSVNETFG